MYRVIRNHCINQNQRNRLVPTEDHSVFDCSVCSDYADAQLLSERQKQLKKTIAGLTRQEQILLFLYKKQFSYKEMAEMVQMNPNSIGKTLSRIIEKITKQIKKANHELFEIG